MSPRAVTFAGLSPGALVEPYAEAGEVGVELFEVGDPLKVTINGFIPLRAGNHGLRITDETSSSRLLLR